MNGFKYREDGPSSASCKGSIFFSIERGRAARKVFMRRQGSIINEYRAQLQQQASEAVAAEERNRLARDMHDSIKQQIFSIRMSAVAAQAYIEKDATKAQEALADIQQSATEAQVEMQALL